MKKIHFLGINGSGIAGVACMAKTQGFEVDGCDLNETGNYTKQLKNLDIDISVGHSPNHLKNIDLLVVSPAIFFNNKYKNIDEVVEATKLGIPIIKWQDFLDEYLVKNKIFITICGTHGKTTTTTLISNILDESNLNPSCIIGGINPKWDCSFKNGNGKHFVCEADEYNHNFHAYHPNYIILNNIEMEHPEFFKNLEEYKQTFYEFLQNIKKDGTIIFNADNSNNLELIQNLEEFLKQNNIKSIGFSLQNLKLDSDFIKIKQIKALSLNSFSFDEQIYKLKNIFGLHNISNILASLILGQELNINSDSLKQSIENSILPKRRMEKILDTKKISIFDDYAHHHSQIYYNLATLKEQKESNEKIIAIVEPHLISRFKNNSKEYIDYIEIADYSIFTKIFKSREANLPDLNIKDYLFDGKVQYIEEFDGVINEVNNIISQKENEKNKFLVVVMGAGSSYELSEKLKIEYA